MADHELKSWPESFEPVMNGTKSFELRKNDRDYKVGDRLHLREWEPKLGDWDRRLGSGTYTGRECWREVVYVLDGIGTGCIEPLKGLNHGYCILGIK